MVYYKISQLHVCDFSRVLEEKPNEYALFQRGVLALGLKTSRHAWERALTVHMGLLPNLPVL